MDNRPVTARIFPTNTRTTYEAFNIVDFNLSVPNRKIMLNSIKLEGRVSFFSNGTTRTVPTDNIFIDPMIGASCLFQDYTTSTDNQGVLEVFQGQPRFEKMMLSALQTPNDNFDSHNVQMMRAPSAAQVRDVIQGEGVVSVATPNPNTMTPTSFCVKPVFILNQASSKVQGGDTHLRSDVTGNILISVRLARNEDVLFGSGTTAGSNYKISDLALTFKHVPDDGNQTPLIMRTKTQLRQTIQSSFANFSANVNGLVNGVSISFLNSADEGNMQENTLKLDKPEAVSNLQFLMNDSQNQLLTFNLDTSQNILKNYLESISNSSQNTAQLWKLKANESYGVGLSFREFLDLSSNRLSMNMTSGIATAGASSSYELYAYFNGVQEIA